MSELEHGSAQDPDGINLKTDPKAWRSSMSKTLLVAMLLSLPLLFQPGAKSNRSPAILRASAAVHRAPLPSEDVCSCGFDCGSNSCTFDCSGSILGCISCVANCCQVAKQAEGCVRQ